MTPALRIFPRVRAQHAGTHGSPPEFRSWGPYSPDILRGAVQRPARRPPRLPDGAERAYRRRSYRRRGPKPASLGPVSGLAPIKLMWSSMTTVRPPEIEVSRRRRHLSPAAFPHPALSSHGRARRCGTWDVPHKNENAPACTRRRAPPDGPAQNVPRAPARWKRESREWRRIPQKTDPPAHGQTAQPAAQDQAHRRARAGHGAMGVYRVLIISFQGFSPFASGCFSARSESAGWIKRAGG